MKETEITVEVLDSLENLQSLLSHKGFVLDEEVVMTDHYFSKYEMEELKKMSYKDLINKSFLVRQLRSDETKSMIIFKSKDYDENGNVIAEEKVSSKVEDFEKMLKIFALSKINCWCEIKQDMFIYHKGKVQFAVQVVDGLGVFIEYEETDDIKDLSEQEKIDSMLGDLREIGIKMGNDFSCKKVFMKFKNDNNLQ